MKKEGIDYLREAKTSPEPDGVVRVENGPEHVHLFPDGVIGDDTSLQLREVVPAALDSDLDGRVLGLEGSVKNLLDAAPAVLERRLYGVGGADT